MNNQNPGIRRFFKARNPRTFAKLRASLIKQADLSGEDVPSESVVGSATISRIEGGASAREGTVRKLYGVLKEKREKQGLKIAPFNKIFESVNPKIVPKQSYDWESLVAGAKRVGNFIFKKFRADVVLTYTGASSIFANLVMVKTLSREKLLGTPVYVAMIIDRGPSTKIPDLPGFKMLEADEFIILMPKALAEGDPTRKKKIAIIDDSVTTGRPLRVLRTYLYDELGYKPENIRVACCVCFVGPIAMRDETTPDFWAFKNATIEYRLPWGGPLYFPRP